MPRYIDVNKQLVRLYRLNLFCEDTIKQFLISADTEDAEPVRHGRWVRNIRNRWACDKCECEAQVIRSPYCPNCGAKMDEVEEESELDKLQAYLEEHGFYYKRIDKEDKSFGIDKHQIIVYETAECTEECWLWDAVCQYGPYGYKDGLLEIVGVIVDKAEVGDMVEGYLTAEDVIERIKAWERANMDEKYEK